MVKDIDLHAYPIDLDAAGTITLWVVETQYDNGQGFLRRVYTDHEHAAKSFAYIGTIPDTDWVTLYEVDVTNEWNAIAETSRPGVTPRTGPVPN